MRDKSVAGVGCLGLFWTAMQPVGADMPAVFNAVGCSIRGGDRAGRLFAALAFWEGASALYADTMAQETDPQRARVLKKKKSFILLKNSCTAYGYA